MLRSVVECSIGGTKRSSFAGDRRKARTPMGNALSEAHCRLFYELASMLHIVRMRFRGQLHMSNPAVLQHDRGGINEARKIINEQLHLLYTHNSRKNAFFGCSLNGLGIEEPDIIPL